MIRSLLAVLIVCAGLTAGDCGGSDLRLAPPPGTYGVVVPVVPLVRLAAGERLVYTVDGSAPTAASWPVNAPVLITDTTTVRVAMVSSQGVVTRSVDGTYTVSGVLSTARPVAAPPAGAYPTSQLVTLTCPTVGAEIRYTLDGSQPTQCSPRYTAPIAIGSSSTLRARAFGGQLLVRAGRFTLRVPAVFPSGVMTATYVITGQQQVATPVIAPATGLYRSELTATATTSTPGAVLRYRLDGTEPGPTDAILPADGIVIDRSQDLRVRAFLDGWTDSQVASASYTLQAPEPEIAPASGLAHVSITVSISIPPGSTVRYTTDGSDPVATSDLVSGPITVARNLQIRAQAERAGWTSSAVVTAAYTLQPLPPMTSLPAGNYVGEQSVTLSDATADTTIRYTLDGTLPTSGSSTATGPIVLPGSCTVTAVASRAGWTDSQPVAVSYVLQVPAPALTPASGAYNEAPTIAASGVGTIRYTLDGTIPTATSPVLSADMVLDRSTTVTVAAFRDGWLASAPVSAAYELRLLPPTANVPAGTYTSEQSVTLTAGSQGSTISATVDGSDPASSATAQVVTAPLFIASGLTLRAVAKREGWTSSPELALTYVFRVPAPTLTPAAGTYSAPVQVQATAATGAIHVTTDGADPTAASPILPAEGIMLDAPGSVAVIATRDGWASSAIVRAAYAFQIATPTWTTAPALAVGSVTVAAQTASPGVTLRYTLDGSVPTDASPELPATLTRSRTVTVVGFRDGWQASEPLTALWTVTPTVAFGRASLTLPVSAGAVSVPIQLSDATDHDVVVGIQGVNGTARFGTDLTVIPATVTIPAGAISADVTLQALAGAEDRPTVTMTVRLVDVVGAELGSTVALDVSIPGVVGPSPVFTQRQTPLNRLPVERFDAARWSSDIGYREAYLAARVPERVWDTLSPTESTRRLVVVGPTRYAGTVGSVVTVVVESAPHVPVSCCVDRPDIAGVLGLAAWTAVTDSEGKAEMQLSISSAGYARVIIGSPAAVGSGHVVIEGSKP